MKKSGFLDMSFTWTFAIVIGAFILFLAIYFAVSLSKTSGVEQDVIKSKEIGILLNPIEIGFESAKTNYLELPVETRIYNKCNNIGDFGKQTILVSQKTFGSWSEDGMNVSFKNRYIFSETPVEGKVFYLFSKPFEFPFKVSDLVYMISAKKNYCFVKPPKNISQEIVDLKLINIVNVTTPTDPKCLGREKVCFVTTTGSSGCNTTVNKTAGFVQKGSKKMYFDREELMYAAIFSDPGIYECQLKRLMQRVNELVLLYDKKATFINSKGCSSSLSLTSLTSLISNYRDSKDLGTITQTVEEIKNMNDNGDCRLW